MNEVQHLGHAYRSIFRPFLDTDRNLAAKNCSRKGREEGMTGGKNEILS